MCTLRRCCCGCDCCARGLGAEPFCSGRRGTVSSEAQRGTKHRSSKHAHDGNRRWSRGDDGAVRLPRGDAPSTNADHRGAEERRVFAARPNSVAARKGSGRALVTFPGGRGLHAIRRPAPPILIGSVMRGDRWNECVRHRELELLCCLHSAQMLSIGIPSPVACAADPYLLF